MWLFKVVPSRVFSMSIPSSGGTKLYNTDKSDGTFSASGGLPFSISSFSWCRIPALLLPALHTTENLSVTLAICPVRAMGYTAGPPAGCFFMPTPDGRLPTNPTAGNDAVPDQLFPLSQFSLVLYETCLPVEPCNCSLAGCKIEEEV